MGVHRVAQVSHDVLPDLVGHVGLENPHARVGRGNRDHHAAQNPQKVDVGAAFRRHTQSIVEDHLDEHRVHHAQGGGCDDEYHDYGDLDPVGAEKPYYPRHERPVGVGRRVNGGWLRRCAAGAVWRQRNHFGKSTSLSSARARGAGRVIWHSITAFYIK